MLYIRLFHGRTDPEQEMNDWGSDGPIFGPYSYVHTTYGHQLKLCRSDNMFDELFVNSEDLLYYDGVYYGDWSVFNAEILAKGQYCPTQFVQEKANLPQK